ncbi:hypothetical protein IAT38_007603 [Cryptococcus sp. DSM 104549]
MTEQHRPPRRRSSSSSAGVGRRGESAHTKRSTSMSTVSASGSEWDDGENWEEGGPGVSAMPAPTRKRREEQMSPVVVVLYVIAFWLVWQILTRPDDMEIFTPHSAASPIHQPHTPPSLGHSQYNLPYPMPQLPTPPITTAEPSNPWWRVIINIIVYPIYLAVTLLAVPFPFILNALSLIFQILGTLLWPVTMSSRLFFRTFIRGPWGVIRGVLEMFYPLYVFAASVVGVGCVLGVGAGWVGRVCLGWFVKWKEGGKKAREGKKSRRRSSAARVSPSMDAPALAPKEPSRRLERRHSSHRAAPVPAGTSSNPKLRRADTLDTHSHAHAYSRRHLRPTPPSGGSSTEQPVTPTRERELRSHHTLLEPVSLFSGDRKKGKQLAWEEEGRGTAREPVVLGVRRRGVREASVRA